MHPDLPAKTAFFGYTDLFTLDQKYLGGAIVAKRGTPILLTVTNLLPERHWESAVENASISKDSFHGLSPNFTIRTCFL